MNSCGDWARAKNFPGCSRTGRRKSRAPSGVPRVMLGVQTSTKPRSSMTRRMQRNLRLNHTAISAIRRVMDERGFVDVWTPSMTRGTPEGARDFLLPVRLQPGKFFALAQSPQLFMVGGIDRYYQIATCWRDEDLRADRQFEFRQLDLELAFVEREDVLDVMEACVVGAFEAAAAEPPQRPFPRLGYDDVMLRYGSDKPDLRFGLEIQ